MYRRHLFSALLTNQHLKFVSFTAMSPKRIANPITTIMTSKDTTSINEPSQSTPTALSGEEHKTGIEV